MPDDRRTTMLARRRPAGTRSTASESRPAPLLEVDDVTMRFGGVTALDGVTFHINDGRDLRAHRPQRRRQDHLLQRDDRRLPADRGRGPLRRASRSASCKRFQITKLGHRPDVPEHPAVPEHDGAGERDGRRRRPPPHRRGLGAAAAAASTTREEAEGQRAGAASCSSSWASASGPTSWPATCPTATSAGSRSPARWPPTRSCSASTSRPPASTRPRRRG